MNFHSDGRRTSMERSSREKQSTKEALKYMYPNLKMRQWKRHGQKMSNPEKHVAKV